MVSRTTRATGSMLIRLASMAAAAAQRGDLFDGIGGRGDAGHGDVGTSGGQCHGDALAQTGIATGYQSDLAFRAEGISHCVCVP